ncbi:MAG: carboxypeptidase-like regulatory domain-containing protein [Bacteroidia bacterium]|nr:carboxypeptidase-like regulatory domain-containing protein [Bacteroidia bacterium]
MRLSIFSLCFLFFISAAAQSKQDENLVQFTGIVVTGDSLTGVPYVVVKVKGTSHGTITDIYGFFSFVARQKDTIEFTCLGLRKARFVIPDTLTDHRLSLIQLMHADTIVLPQANVYPWPTKEEFKQAFINLQLPDDDYVRAKQTLDKNNLDAIALNLPADGSLSFKYTLNERNSQLYYAGQLPQNTLLNPIAWAKFIDAWKKGAFKRKDE